MPIRIEFRHDGGMIMKGTGVITFRDLKASNEVIYHSSQRLRRTVYQIVDLLDAERVELTEEDVRELARQDVDAVGDQYHMVIALVFGNSLPKDFAKLWQSGAEGSQLVTGIFHDREAAEAWVLAQRKPALPIDPPLLA